MPTSYTADIAKGITFLEYALGCARAFGACVEMRDEPRDAEIPEEFEVSNYQTEQLNKYLKEKTELLKITPTQTVEEAHKKYIEDESCRLKTLEKHKQLYIKYTEMLEQVEGWKPPTQEHVEYKAFMVQQLKDSRKFDCGATYYEEPTVSLSGKEWLIQELHKVDNSIKYHREEIVEETKRNNNRNAWVKALRESLK